MFAAVTASRSRHVPVGRVSGRAAAVCRLAGGGADGAETPPHQDSGDEQEKDAAGQPDARGQLPAGPVATFAACAQSAEHLALLPHRVGCLARHTQKVGCARQEVGKVRAGVADGDAIFVREALAFVAHQDAVPVGIVHDAVEGVHAAGDRRPAHSGRAAGDVVDGDSHAAGGRGASGAELLAFWLPARFQSQKLHFLI